MKVECLVLIKRKPEGSVKEYTESSFRIGINGKTKDVLKFVAMLKRRYGKENVL